MRINMTHHHYSLRDRTTRRHLARLRHDWNNLSDLKRGRRIQDLLDRGCSIRGLAKSLGNGPAGIQVSEATLRRCLELTRLPEKVQAAIDAGKISPDAALLLARDSRRLNEYLKNLTTAEAKEREVQHLADLVRSILVRAGNPWSVKCEQIVTEVEQRIHYREVLNERDPVHYPLPSPAPAGADPWQVFADCRPVFKPSEEPIWFELLIEQLTDFLPKIAPSPGARDEALGRLRYQYQLAAPSEK